VRCRLAWPGAEPWYAFGRIVTDEIRILSMTIPTKTELWLRRAREVLTHTAGAGASEKVQFATSTLSAFYGPHSAQLKSFLEGCAAITKGSSGVGNAAHHLFLHAYGTIKNTVAEIEQGLKGAGCRGNPLRTDTPGKRSTPGAKRRESMKT
jgi:hypothetical protein